jgi:transcriptional regulator
MYNPPAFLEERPEVLHGLIKAHPLGLLITAGAGGIVANPLPFQLVVEEGGALLRAHMSRANPHLADLENTDCLVAFQGPQAYVSPSWYATKPETGKVVPTWNYIVVQARGRARRVDDPAWLRAQVEAMTRAREAAFAEPWAVDDAPADYVAAQIRGIAGVEIEVERLDGKWKLSQNRATADREGVVEGLRTQGDDDLAQAVSRALAEGSDG